MLSRDRIVSTGQTPHAHERDTYDWVVQQLPDTDPYRLWAFVDLIDAAGRRYDLDLLVLGYHALYLVEMKCHPGTIAGDEVDWQVTFPGGGRTLIENPLRTTTHKARVLASLLERQFGRDPASRGLRAPWVQPLIFLAHPEVSVKLTQGGRMHVVTRGDFVDAVKFGRFPGAPERLLDRRVDTPLGKATHRGLQALGLRASAAALKVDGLLLRDLLEDGSYFQDHLGVAEAIGLQRRVRSYVVPVNATAERREQLHRAAAREARLLNALSHPGVLRFFNYVPEGPLGGPCVVLEHLEGAVPLDAFLRADPDLSLDDRLGILSQLAEALESCHRKQIVHRGLNPRAVLVARGRPELGATGPGPLQVRLYNFQLAAAGDTTGTVHMTALSPEHGEVYLAPEVVEKPSSANATSDVFSLGAIAYHVLTGRPPGSNLAERKVLLAAGHLSVAAVRDDLAGLVDDAVAMATEVNPQGRADSAIEWVSILLDACTAPPEPEKPFTRPEDARPGDLLAPDLEVIGLLGSGSTARVLRVRRGDTEHALKVSSGPEHDERLCREAQILRALDNPRIVSLADELTLGDRTCLLLTYAGESLAVLLSREGPPSLDFARRWGEDLLHALQSLEERGLQHRDIKPANLGVLTGQAKKRRSLLLFDFSLSTAPDTAVTAGTPAYRDPFLEARGRWDSAADRWAAAVTLHELLTGTRPSWPGELALATNADIEIAAERFDAAVRARLHGFFRRALARDVATRYATAEKMLVEWTACFATSVWTGVEEETEHGAPPPAVVDLSKLSLDTPVGALPLSARAKNAIDRAGMTTLAELLAMPQNRLSTARGIGSQTHKEILKFVEDARAALGAAATVTASGPPFLEGYAGPAGNVIFVAGLAPEAARALEDAGLGELTLVASAPRTQLSRILAAHPGAEAALLTFLEGAAGANTAPATVEDWIEQLFAPRARSKRATYLKTSAQLFGLEPVPGLAAAECAGSATALARALGVTRAAVHIALGKAEDRWREHVHLADLEARVWRCLEGLGGVAALGRVAAALAIELPHRPATPAADPDLVAEAVVRAVAMTSERLVQGRINGRLWLAQGHAELGVARALGHAADELAVREPLPSSEEVRDALGRLAAGGPLATLGLDRLVALAAEASSQAARSARLELYPRGLPAARALALSAGALSWQSTPEQVGRAVRARYPEAEPPPPRPALDELLRPLGLAWDQARGAYTRPGAILPTSGQTAFAPRVPTTHTQHRRPPESRESQEALDFEASLKIAVAKGHFRVLDVSASYDEAAAEELARRTGAARISLEREVLAESEKLMAEWGVEPAVVLEADRGGPRERDDWENLRRLMREAAGRALARVTAGRRPVILTQPGILARYGLDEVIGRLVEQAQRDDATSILLVNPTDDAAPPAPIDASTRPVPVPLSSQAQRLRVPEAWIRNLPRGGMV